MNAPRNATASTWFPQSMALALGLGTWLAASSSPAVLVFTNNISNDMLAMELASTTGVNPNGPWTYGGYDDLVTPVFTPFGVAQHLENWGTFLPPAGPYTGGEFQGYGFDTPSAIPAIVINTTGSSLSPCCGIDTYAPGEIFVHSAVTGDYTPQVPPGAFNLPTIRYTALEPGIADVSITFTKKHSGNIPYNVFLNGVSIFSSTIATAQGTSQTYINNGLNMLPGDTLDFIIQGRASAAIDGTIILATQVPEPSTLFLLGLGTVAAFCKSRRRRMPV